jgi:hypothetical protein
VREKASPFWIILLLVEGDPELQGSNLQRQDWRKESSKNATPQDVEAREYLRTKLFICPQLGANSILRSIRSGKRIVDVTRPSLQYKRLGIALRM